MFCAGHCLPGFARAHTTPLTSLSAPLRRTYASSSRYILVVTVKKNGGIKRTYRSIDLHPERLRLFLCYENKQQLRPRSCFSRDTSFDKYEDIAILRRKEKIYIFASFLLRHDYLIKIHLRDKFTIISIHQY